MHPATDEYEASPLVSGPRVNVVKLKSNPAASQVDWPRACVTKIFWPCLAVMMSAAHFATGSRLKLSHIELSVA
jgi:hypothetical protein